MRGRFLLRKCKYVLKFLFLSDRFYIDHLKFTEIEQKQTRPYVRVEIEINGTLFGIPLRSNISHPHVYWTDKANKCGVDFSKAVVISKPDVYIDQAKKPRIRPDEFESLRGKDHIIKQRMLKYIADYKKAKANPDVPRNALLLRYSTLQYFEEYI